MLLFAGVLAVAGCRKQDVRTVTVSIPEMHNSACVRIVGDALVKQMGVKPDALMFNLEQKTVMVTYDSLIIARKNIEFAIADVGFSANEVPADTNAAAALPPECRLQ